VLGECSQGSDEEPGDRGWVPINPLSLFYNKAVMINLAFSQVQDLAREANPGRETVQEHHSGSKHCQTFYSAQEAV